MNNNIIHTIDTVKDADALIEIISTGAVFPLVVTGSSMLPFLREERDTVCLQKPGTLKKGQIVFFKNRMGGFTLHRIRKIRRDGSLLINGDAQAWCEIISPDAVIATVVCIIKGDRRILPDAFSTKLLSFLWYPTRSIRPLIWKTYGVICKIFKKN